MIFLSSRLHVDLSGAKPATTDVCEGSATHRARSREHRLSLSPGHGEGRCRFFPQNQQNQQNENDRNETVGKAPRSLSPGDDDLRAVFQCPERLLDSVWRSLARNSLSYRRNKILRRATQPAIERHENSESPSPTSRGFFLCGTAGTAVKTDHGV